MEMISAKFLWGNVLLGGKLQIGAKNSNFEIFESALLYEISEYAFNFHQYLIDKQSMVIKRG